MIYNKRISQDLFRSWERIQLKLVYKAKALQYIYSIFAYRKYVTSILYLCQEKPPKTTQGKFNYKPAVYIF